MNANRLLGASALASAICLIPVHAYAQTSDASPSSSTPGATANTSDAQLDQANSQATPPSDIVVTGTRIDRPDLTAASPVASISAAALKVNNSVTVEQILNSNPQFVPGATGASNNPADGAATLDLRGLGARRTLVLIDGKRAPSYSTNGEVDVNAIPTALIKRVDVLTGGASAVYGSDAIAGVVNFVLDDRFTGLRADASSQITERGDGAQYDASLTGGIALGDRGNLVLSGGYSKRQGVTFGARKRNSQVLDSSDLSPTGSSNANPTIFDLPNGDEVQVNDAGNLVDVYNPYNYQPVAYAQIPLNRYTATALARYQISDGIEFFARGSYEHTKVQSLLAPTATAGYNFNISPDNPFLTPDERAVFFGPGAALNPDGTAPIGIRRRVTETGGRLQNFTANSYQVVGGLRGSFGADYNWEVFGQYARVTRRQDLLNDLSYSALSQAVDAVAGPNGPECRDPSNGCVPIDLFTAGTISKDALNFVEANGEVSERTTQFVAGADLSGNLGFLKSPFASGPAAFSVGAEYRRETGSTVANPKYASGDLIYYGQGSSLAGHYDVKEAYVELKMPLVQDKPLIKALNLEGGLRYSDYSTSGTVYSYKAGGDYSPVDGVRLRGIYQRAVRAPNLAELFSPYPVAGTGSLSHDYCVGAEGVTYAAICEAQGASPGVIGNIAPPISGQINVFTGGNPELKAEKSDTYTLGIVVNPPSLRALSLSVDYYNITIANAIDFTPPQVTLDQCFLVDKSATSPACSSIVRNANGQISGGVAIGVPEREGNTASLKTDGIDVDLSYHGGNRNAFNYAIDYAGTYTLNFKKQSSPETASIQCAGRFGSSCNLEPIPHYKHTLSVDLGYGAVSFNTRWRYLGAVREDAGTDILVSRIKAVSYFDETASIDVDNRFTLRLGVQNLFDKKPPIVGDTVGNDFNTGSTFPVFYDVLGRSYFAGFSAKF